MTRMLGRLVRKPHFTTEPTETTERKPQRVLRVLCELCGDREWCVARVGAGSERGTALISILLLLIIMSALSAALTISTRTEVMVAKNRQSAAQARAAAEAGLNHSSELVITNLLTWQAAGFASTSAAVTRLLRGPDNQTGTTATDADNGSLETLGIPRPPTRLGLNNLPGVGYEARMFDEDDAGRGLTLSAADLVSIGENATGATTDGNSTILVRSIGYANDGTQLILEATISRIALPAILTGGDLRISGNTDITGDAASVHSNQDLDMNGSAIDIDHNATSSGTYSTTGSPDVGGVAGGGRPPMPFAPIRAADYLSHADFVLNSDGRLTDRATGLTLCNAAGAPNACQVVYGWTYDGPGWSVNGNANNYMPGTYYVQGPVTMGGSPGGNNLATAWQVSIIAEGSIDISGSPDVKTDDPDLLLVTDGDLKISGNFTQWGAEAQILIHEQFDIGGNVTLVGRITAEDGGNASNLVTSNRVHGSVTINYDATGGGSGFNISAWREVR